MCTSFNAIGDRQHFRQTIAIAIIPTFRLNYRYRDAHNYKEFGSVVFANPTGMPVEAATALLRVKLISEESRSGQ